MHCWYWVSDFCRDIKVGFILGHALYMKAIHGGKAKNDKIDSYKIVSLMRGDNFPLAYDYPSEYRTTCDLLRRRTHFMRHGASLKAHVESFIEKEARNDCPVLRHIIRTFPGIRQILALAILYEIGDIGRFASVQKFVSYSR